MTDTATRIGPASTNGIDRPRNAHTARSHRSVANHSTTAERLGPLADLPGFWQGTGFNLVARPDADPKNPDGFFLQLNLLRETIEFTPIGSPVPNRGSTQGDISLYGVTYLHRVSDAVTGGALHIEPGVWMTTAADTDPEAKETVARLFTVPHGNSVCAVGFPQYVVPDGLPTIPPANTIPFPIGGETPTTGAPNPYSAYDLSVETPFRTNPLPATVTQALVDDPNTLVRNALQGQTLTHITRLIVSTENGGGISNIPFITANADTPVLESVFAIERVQGPDGREMLQLQYSQSTLLNFDGMSWPHVTVGTLLRTF